MPRFSAAPSWLRAHPVRADVLLAGCAVAVSCLGWFASPPDYRPTASGAVSVLWIVLGATPIVIRRRWTTAALGLTLLLGVMSIVLFSTSSTEAYALVILTYTVAAYWPLRRAFAAAMTLWVPIIALAMLIRLLRPEFGPAWLASPGIVFVTNVTILALAMLAGRYMRTRRLYEADLHERTRVAESSQLALADQAVADERRRIARELHDVVAHHVSVMGILATGARRSMAADPAAADAALSTIEETGRTTLRELRRLLNILRADDEQPDLEPQPGLAAVTALVEQLRETGLPVRLDVDGDPYDLEPGVALTIYRIVQEALTNTLKHAGRASANIRLTFGSNRLDVEALDDGRGPAIRPNRSGHGLVGIRERVALYGGQLRVGPRPGGGFRIAASIPLDGAGSVTGRD